MRTPSQDFSYLGGSGIRAMLIGLVPNLCVSRRTSSASLGIVEVDDQRVELLLLDARQRCFRIAGTIHGDLETGQNSPQYVSRRVIARYQ